MVLYLKHWPIFFYFFFIYHHFCISHCFLLFTPSLIHLLLSHPYLTHPVLQVWTRSRKRWTTFNPSTRVRTSQLTRRSTRTSPVLQTQTTFSLSSTLSLMSSSLTTCASVVFTNSQWCSALLQPHHTVTTTVGYVTFCLCFILLIVSIGVLLMSFYKVRTDSNLVIVFTELFFNLCAIF